MRKEGWEPYPLKIKYLIPLIIYVLGFYAAIGYQWSLIPPISFIEVFGVISIMLTFIIQYYIGIKKLFNDLVLKFRSSHFAPLLGWTIGATILALIEAVVIQDIMTPYQLFAVFVILGIGAFYYFIGMIIVYRNIKDISI